MLPKTSSPEFPGALKAIRESLGLSRSDLAQAAGIHPVMPRRYEEPDCLAFTRPTEKTMAALNRALGLSNATPVHTATASAVLLHDASTDQIVAELRHRGIAATLTFPVI